MKEAALTCIKRVTLTQKTQSRRDCQFLMTSLMKKSVLQAEKSLSKSTQKTNLVRLR